MLIHSACGEHFLGDLDTILRAWISEKPWSEKKIEQGQRDMLASGSKQNATQKLSETHQALKLDWETRIPQDTLCTQFKERFLSDLSLALVKASGRCRCRWVKGPRSLAVLTGRRLGEVRYIEPVGGTTTPPRVD